MEANLQQQLRSRPTTNDERIRGGVGQKHDAAEPPLQLPGERRRVQKGHEVVLDERRGVACLAAPLSQPVFERRERADPASEFDPRAPGRCWNMHPDEARPPQCEQATQEHEHNEGKMKDHGGVGEDPEGHLGEARRCDVAAPAEAYSGLRNSKPTANRVCTVSSGSKPQAR